MDTQVTVDGRPLTANKLVALSVKSQHCTKGWPLKLSDGTLMPMPCGSRKCPICRYGWVAARKKPIIDRMKSVLAGDSSLEMMFITLTYADGDNLPTEELRSAALQGAGVSWKDSPDWVNYFTGTYVPYFLNPDVDDAHIDDCDIDIESGEVTSRQYNLPDSFGLVLSRALKTESDRRCAYVGHSRTKFFERYRKLEAKRLGYTVKSNRARFGDRSYGLADVTQLFYFATAGYGKIGGRYHLHFLAVCNRESLAKTFDWWRQRYGHTDCKFHGRDMQAAQGRIGYIAGYSASNTASRVSYDAKSSTYINLRVKNARAPYKLAHEALNKLSGLTATPLLREDLKDSDIQDQYKSARAKSFILEQRVLKLQKYRKRIQTNGNYQLGLSTRDLGNVVRGDESGLIAEWIGSFRLTVKPDPRQRPSDSPPEWPGRPNPDEQGDRPRLWAPKP
jgi:hypothetical protein